MNDLLNKINLDIPEILSSSKNIAIVGISDKPHRDSYSVASYLKRSGFIIFPVNPKLETVLGLPCYENLMAIDAPVDIVNIFRKPESVLPVVEEAIRIGAKTVWMQFGVINKEAALLALASGLNVVMDRCIKVENSVHTR